MVLIIFVSAQLYPASSYSSLVPALWASSVHRLPGGVLRQRQGRWMAWPRRLLGHHALAALSWQEDQWCCCGKGQALCTYVWVNQRWVPLSDWVFCWVVADFVACMVSAAVLITFPAFRSLNHVFCCYVVTSKHLVELMPARSAHSYYVESNKDGFVWPCSIFILANWCESVSVCVPARACVQGFCASPKYPSIKVPQLA